MELSNIYEIWDRFEKSEVAELELDMQEVHLVLKKSTACQNSTCISYPIQPFATTQMNVPMNTADSAENAQMDSQPAQTSVAKDNTICSPLVGTFFTAPEPGAEPYIQVGTSVKRGDVIGIIEAMKLMNEVRADRDGVVSAIMVNDGDMVEYDQILVELQ